jgi:hypothetical protein
VKGRIRWAIFWGFFSLTLAIALGVGALVFGDEETKVAATPAGPIEGNYAFVSTTINTSVPGTNGAPSPLSITGGRLSIGGDAHAFWSLQMVSAGNSTRTGRLTCEGTFNRETNTIALEPRFQFDNFPPEANRREVQEQLYMMFCVVASSPATSMAAVQQNAGLLQLSGAAGSINWRRE